MIIDDLITDRTQADVVALNTLRAKILENGWASLTATEQNTWNAGMRGAWTYTDLNRIGQAIDYVVTFARNIGWDNIPSVTTKTDWAVTDIPTTNLLSQYIRIPLTAIRGMITVPDGTPSVPSNFNAMSVGKANNIEKIILAVYNQLVLADQSNVYADEGYAGESLEYA